MLAAKAPHPNCAYLWTKYVSTAHVQAQQALSYGETPVNSKACAEMDALGGGGSCAAFHADAVGSYFDNIKFWKTPIADCGNGSTNCKAYADWQTAWTAIKG
jgi:putative spermidine/putrescine transport system substrate-binding protein